ncbi:MAG: 16S rRNA (cytosine(1402)-N(4))-methyltransferase RsmH [Burkholderiales bacterium]|nr:16S rRNA (cytosine(1402)-N(4))-methyltransferase RsmH [Burkholderiales bacterium]
MSDGAHAAVLAREAVEGLKVRGGGIYVDCTFGRGGHSRLILARLAPAGRLLAIDRDAAAVAAGGKINDARFSIVHGRFSRLAGIAAAAGIGAADGILMDLGVSSPQLDEPARGFSFRHDAPLDMRMDAGAGPTAADWLGQASLQELREVIRGYGEERFAKQIAAAIVAARARGPLRTTRQLAALVAAAVPAREPHQDPATRTFQALRIHVNQELEELSLALPQCTALLRPGGRLVVISFHSLEDRIVKRFLRGEARPDRLPERLPVRAAEIARPRLALVGRALRPAAAEIAANPRARSAVMRIAEKLAA